LTDSGTDLSITVAAHPSQLWHVNFTSSVLEVGGNPTRLRSPSRSGIPLWLLTDGVRLSAAECHSTTNPVTGEAISLGAREGDAEV